MAKFNMDAFKKAQKNKTGKVTKFIPSELIPEGTRTLSITDAKESKTKKGIVLYFNDSELTNGTCFLYTGYDNENQIAVLMVIADEIGLNFTPETDIKDFIGGKIKAVIEHNNDDFKYTKDGEKTLYELPKTMLGGKMTEEEAIANGWTKEANPKAEIIEVLETKTTTKGAKVVKTEKVEVKSEDDLLNDFETGYNLDDDVPVDDDVASDSTDDSNDDLDSDMDFEMEDLL